MSAPFEDLSALVGGLPKAELHMHHVGSASPRTVAALAARNAGSTAVPIDEAALRDYFTVTDFGHFIRVYLHDRPSGPRLREPMVSARIRLGSSRGSRRSVTWCAASPARGTPRWSRPS